MNRLQLLLVAAASLPVAGCGTGLVAPTNLATGLSDAATIVASGQLVCKIGQAYAAMQAATGATVNPIYAKGASSSFVQHTCEAFNGSAVALPSGTTPGSITIPSIQLPTS